MKNTIKKERRKFGKTRSHKMQKPVSLHHFSEFEMQKGIKALNCSPIVDGKTIMAGSCFTPTALEQLKKYYNDKHPNNPVVANSPSELWNEFRKRMFSCKSEDCWLKEIDNVELRENLEKFLFAPFQPNEWRKNPNEWLSNFDIFDILHQYELTHPSFKVLGPSPIDFDSRPSDENGKCVWEELCKFDIEKYKASGKTKLGLVFNLDKHNQGGSHWVSMFVDLEDKFIFYLDSAGNKTPKEIKALANKIKTQGKESTPPIPFKFYENYPLEHQMGNTECGMYSLYFIITMLTGEVECTPSKNSNDTRTERSISNPHRFKDSKDKIRFFKEKRIPDKYVSKYRKIYFNV